MEVVGIWVGWTSWNWIVQDLQEKTQKREKRNSDGDWDTTTNNDNFYEWMRHGSSAKRWMNDDLLWEWPRKLKANRTTT